MTLENLADTMLECHTTAAQIAGSAPREAAVLMVACKEAIAGQFPKRTIERVGPPSDFDVEVSEQCSAEAARQRAEARLAYYESPQPRVAQCLVEQYSDEHFTGCDPQAICECENDEYALSLYLHREGVQQLHNWPNIAAGLAEYNRQPKWERGSWLAGRSIEAEAVREYFGLLEYVTQVEESCPADKHYRQTELDLELGKPVFTSHDPEKSEVTAARWHDAEWKRLAWPVVSFQHHYRERGYTGGRLDGDGTRGFRADPTWIASEQRLESEYHLPRVESVDGQMVIRRGHTQREYKRRVWCEANGRLVLPWMSSNAFAFHARFLRAADRRRLLRKRQRAQIARLVTALGGDLHDPAVVSWVKEHGYEVALDKLRARARREGVGLYA